MAGTASADTLREALVSTYHTNPTLTGQRENLKATDATVAIAKAAGRPQVSATAGINRDLSRSGILDTGGHGPTLSAGVDISYPLFSGGSVALLYFALGLLIRSASGSGRQSWLP